MSDTSSTITALISLALTVGVAYGLAYWSFRAQYDRSAFVGLYLLFGIPGGLLVIAGAAVLSRGDPRLGVLLLAIGLGLALPLSEQLRAWLARIIPIDPGSPMDMTGLCLLFGLVGFFGAPLVMPGAEAPPAAAAIGSVNYVELVGQAVAFVLIAYMAVGWRIPTFVSTPGRPFVRTDEEATRRLGIVRPDLRTVGVGLAAVPVCFLLAGVIGAIANQLQPGLAEGLESIVDEMTRNVQNPFGAAVLGASAAIGEEAIFRGALQPRLGIGLVSLLFALLHAPQYGLNLTILGLFAVSVVLGLERKYVNTTAAMITHALYNALQVLALALS
ncbi:MAG: CPBP family intramembrane metalloprotease [Thermomicrobiales bacterium]|nr:CPBP family intramembrane metalloprotease [Thermomicrobiales bacterium]